MFKSYAMNKSWKNVFTFDPSMFSTWNMYPMIPRIGGNYVDILHDIHDSDTR